MTGLDTHNGSLWSINKPVLLLQFRAPVLRVAHCSRHPRPSSPFNVFSASKEQLVLEIQEHSKNNWSFDISEMPLDPKTVEKHMGCERVHRIKHICNNQNKFSVK